MFVCIYVVIYFRAWYDGRGRENVIIFPGSAPDLAIFIFNSINFWFEFNSTRSLGFVFCYHGKAFLKAFISTWFWQATIILSSLQYGERNGLLSHFQEES